MKRFHCMFLKLSLDLDEGSHFGHFGPVHHHKLLFITTAADVNILFMAQHVVPCIHRWPLSGSQLHHLRGAFLLSFIPIGDR
ncbi:unnamed protein product [Arctogadus glacialis]